MKKLVLRWVALAVFLVLLATLFVRLGEWQLNRLEGTRERNDVVSANQGRPVIDYREVMGGPVAETSQWQRVRLTGTYTGEQYQVRYRNQDGPGIEVAAVFDTTHGDTVLVNRGFIARQIGKPDTEVLPAVPEGDVEVIGFLRRDERGDDTAVVPHDFKVRLINAEAIGTSLGRDVLPGYVNLVESTPSNGDELVPVVPPPASEGNHFSYALQWFSFSVIAVGGIFVLIRADLADRKKARLRAERRASRKVAVDEPVR
ncbi:MAG: SURF1 family protein [Propionibacteriaceae bacterium]|nr:SURF1 family protein [Propionibacteriaceae bacterium]